jgi:hypothetical protein
MGTLDDGEKVLAPDADTWRAWLEENHRTSTGAWLVRARPGSDLQVVDYEDAIMQALCFGWIDGPVRVFDERTSGLWFAPRRPSSGWAATNKARLILLEERGLMAEAGIRTVEVARRTGRGRCSTTPRRCASPTIWRPRSTPIRPPGRRGTRSLRLRASSASDRSTRRGEPRPVRPASRKSCRIPPPESDRRDRHRRKEAGMSSAEQTLLFAATGIVLLGTLIVFVWQYFRGRGKD